MMKLVAHRNEKLEGSRFWDILEYCITLLMMVVIAFSIARALPIAMVMGSWSINIATGDTRTRSPAIATTDAALAAMASIFTVTAPG